MEKLKKGDSVKVLAGRDRGMQGTILKITERKNKKGELIKAALVEGVNVVKKHVRGNPQAGKAGGIINKELPIMLSNLALINPLTSKADKVGIKTLDDGKKARYFKSSGEVVDA